MRLGWFCSTKNGLDFSHYGRHYAYSISIAWDASSRPGYSCNTKGQRDFISTLAFIASHEAPSPNGGLFYSTVRKLHQTREPRGLSPSGGKTPPKLLFPRALLRAYGAQSGVQGVTPCQTREPRGLSPSGGKTPAKPHVPLRPCAPMARSPGCRGAPSAARPSSEWHPFHANSRRSLPDLRAVAPVVPRR